MEIKGAEMDSKGCLNLRICGGGPDHLMGPRNMDYHQIHEEGVFRFDCSAHHRTSSSPTFSFGNPLIRETPIKDSNIVPDYIPTYECRDQKQIVNIKFPPNTSFYGTGEVSGPLERTGKKIVTWNTDAYGYTGKDSPLYQSHPWVLALLPDGKSIGVLADTTRLCEIDVQKQSNINFISDLPYPVITFGPFVSPAEVVASFARTAGTIFMPPKWALGYHQSRYSYDSADKVNEIANTFRQKHIPCDAIWMDIDYMDGFRCFTFDKKRFPDPKSIVDGLHEKGFRAIWILDPGIKKEKGYSVYDSGSAGYMWVQAADGSPFVGRVWPGDSVFPDFTNSRVRDWWADIVKNFIPNGVDGLWNDMNEPAVWMENGEKTMPRSNVHWGDILLGGVQKHSYYHNVYGMLMAKSSHKGMKLANENKRPFILTRAGFVGSQRYAATWTGDNTSSWEHLQMSIPMVLNLGLSGQPFSGPDIGGFIGNATPELFGRWMGIGTMFPFCRAHSSKESKPHEPWSFGKEVEKICRLAIQRRYRIIPLLYTLFYLAHKKGIPVATPTFFADPTNMELRSQETSFLLGPLLIYASTIEDKNVVQIPHKLPTGIWRGFDFNDSHPELPHLFLKGGSIIPIAPPHESVAEAKPTDDLTLIVSLDRQGQAEGVLYEDDSDGYEYTKGNYLLTTYEAKREGRVVIVKVSKTEGSWKRPKRRLLVQVLLANRKKVEGSGADGEVVKVYLPYNQCEADNGGCDDEGEPDNGWCEGSEDKCEADDGECDSDSAEWCDNICETKI